MNANALPSQKAELLKLMLKKKGFQVGNDAIPRRLATGPAPVSFAQARLWFLSQLEGGNASYNLPCVLRITGLLDVELLRRAIAAIVRRHEVLRTRFQAVDGEPTQVVDAEAGLSFAVVDLGGLAESERLPEAKHLADEATELPFDLAAGPLLKCQVWRLDGRSHVLLVNMHHIVSDGWSIGLFTQELATLYGAFHEGLADPLPPLPIQYADFAVWQRQWLAGERLQKQLDYWKTQLAGLPPLLELPTDRPRPLQQSFHGGVCEFLFDPVASQRCKDLARASGTSVFTTLLAGFAALLARYSGQRDLCVGSLIANRNRKELEPLIGFFVNSLALRFRLAEGLSFQALLRQAGDVALDAQAHQDIPFEQVVEALHPQRDFGHSPLFQVLFDFQVASEVQFALPGLDVSPLPPECITAKFDLCLVVEDRGDCLAGWWEFNSDLFDLSTIQRMSQHYRVLMDAACANPGQSVDTLPLLDAEELIKMLVGWNQTQVAIPDGVCVHELFQRQVDESATVAAVSWEGRTLSYGELNEKANRLAHHLRGLGIGPGTLVGLYLERSLDMLASLLAVLKAGGAYLPLQCC